MVNVKRQIRLENFFKQKLKWKKKNTKHKTQNKTKEQSETILMDEDNVKVIIFFYKSREQLTTSTAKGNLGH